MEYDIIEKSLTNLSRPRLSKVLDDGVEKGDDKCSEHCFLFEVKGISLFHVIGSEDGIPLN